ncbi:MAG TPA: hypothetical protein VLK82_21795 [Candidatus Tectomicrobia bacterium]|nr:hypothetical protein [Candidatus Tectomicrobia bacterium]
MREHARHRPPQLVDRLLMRGIWEKLQPELAHDGVKAAILEGHRLVSRGHRLKRSPAELRVRRREHSRRAGSAKHASRRGDDGHRDPRGLAWARGDIEHAVVVGDRGSGLHGRHEQP